MTEQTTRFDRVPGAYEPPSAGPAEHMEAARSALILGDREGAEAALLAAIASAEHAPNGSALLAAALTRLGEVKHQHGQEPEAEQLLRRALEINERLLGMEHPDLVVLLNDLSRLYLKRGAHADAEPLLLRLHAIKLAKGEDHPEVATVLASLASVRQALGRYDSAEQLWRRVLEIRERTLAPHHFSIATALEHLGETCAARGKLNEALRHRVRALAMRELTLDPGHPSLRTARERIADLQLQASEEVLDVDVADGPRHVPAWPAPVVPSPLPPAAARVETPPAPVPRTGVPREPGPPSPPTPPIASAPAFQAAYHPAPSLAAPPAQPVPARLAERQELPETSLVEDELDDDDPGRPEGADARGLHLVNVAGLGESSRSVIMPYYADAIALANEAAEDPDFHGRPSGGVVANTMAYLRQRQTALLATLGAGVLLVGAIGTGSFARGASQEAKGSEGGGLRPAPITAAASPEPGAIADSAVASGSIDREFAAAERTSDATSAGASTGSRVPDEPAREPRGARSSSEAERNTSSSAAAPAALPRTLNVRLDSVAQAVGAVPAVGADDALSAKVTLPTGIRLRSAASAGEAESQPALLIVAPTPVYPSSLYTKAIAGSAAVEFIVDTNGRVDLSTFKSQSNHELFTESVRRIMPDMRFVPSTRNGRKVRTTIRMRFEFNKSGVSSSRPN